MEGAIKMAKKVTKRSEIITAKNSYHGSSQGSLSIMGIEANKNPFRPLIPGVKQIEYNNFQRFTQNNCQDGSSCFGDHSRGSRLYSA